MQETTVYFSDFSWTSLDIPVIALMVAIREEKKEKDSMACFYKMFNQKNIQIYQQDGVA